MGLFPNNTNYRKIVTKNKKKENQPVYWKILILHEDRFIRTKWLGFEMGRSSQIKGEVIPNQLKCERVFSDVKKSFQNIRFFFSKFIFSMKKVNVLIKLAIKIVLGNWMNWLLCWIQFTLHKNQPHYCRKIVGKSFPMLIQSMHVLKKYFNWK